MLTDVGEYFVGAYLRLIEKCDVVDYNVRQPGGGLDGLGELDVVGLKLQEKRAFICEVTTHIGGLHAKAPPRLKEKHLRQKAYAKRYLKGFDCEYMFWSPYVPIGARLDAIARIKGLKLVVNKDYTAAINELRHRAKTESHDARNPVFRVMQILEHLR